MALKQARTHPDRLPLTCHCAACRAARDVTLTRPERGGRFGGIAAAGAGRDDYVMRVSVACECGGLTVRVRYSKGSPVAPTPKPPSPVPELELVVRREMKKFDGE